VNIEEEEEEEEEEEDALTRFGSKCPFGVKDQLCNTMRGFFY
jgi:hypothetical protein